MGTENKLEGLNFHAFDIQATHTITHGISETTELTLQPTATNQLPINSIPSFSYAAICSICATA